MGMLARRPELYIYLPTFHLTLQNAEHATAQTNSVPLLSVPLPCSSIRFRVSSSHLRWQYGGLSPPKEPSLHVAFVNPTHVYTVSFFVVSCAHEHCVPCVTNPCFGTKRLS